MASIGENLQELRSRRSMTQQELAERVHCGQSMIAQIERGTKALNMELGKVIAQVLECSIEDFIK